ncbi:MAG: hypothetical protein U0835_00095 [Isosphaeraceae bacterium]
MALSYWFEAASEPAVPVVVEVTLRIVWPSSPRLPAAGPLAEDQEEVALRERRRQGQRDLRGIVGDVDAVGDEAVAEVPVTSIDVGFTVLSVLPAKAEEPVPAISGRWPPMRGVAEQRRGRACFPSWRRVLVGDGRSRRAGRRGDVAG